jgi:hypothetical protein
LEDLGKVSVDCLGLNHRFWYFWKHEAEEFSHRIQRLLATYERRFVYIINMLKICPSDLRKNAIDTNNRTVVAAVSGLLDAALDDFLTALSLDPDCEVARLNAALLQAEVSLASPQLVINRSAVIVPPCDTNWPIRIALLSFLFSWPSTGGGIVHTFELAQFLANAGYDVRHFYARHAGWGVGRVDASTPYPSEALAHLRHHTVATVALAKT